MGSFCVNFVCVHLGALARCDVILFMKCDFSVVYLPVSSSETPEGSSPIRPVCVLSHPCRTTLLKSHSKLGGDNRSRISASFESHTSRHQPLSSVYDDEKEGRRRTIVWKGSDVLRALHGNPSQPTTIQLFSLSHKIIKPFKDLTTRI